MKTWLAGVSLCWLVSITAAIAQDVEPIAETSFEAESFEPAEPDTACASCCGAENYCFYPGWFVGLGGSFNSVRVDSVLDGTGLTEVYDDSVLVATGTATGPSPPLRQTQTTFAPVAQVGFIRDFADCGGCDLSWGTKFSYKYLGLVLSTQNVDAPQQGEFTTTDDPPVTTEFTGNAFTLLSQVIVDHELALMPFVSRTFRNGRIYLGGGPVVFGTQVRAYGLSSYADINGQTTNIGGDPLDLASDPWLWGGACQGGLQYYFRPRCFLDFSYDFMVTGLYTQYYDVDTTSTSGSETYVTAITYSTQERIWAQSFNVTFNWAF
jgi:hypothetical protein